MPYTLAPISDGGRAVIQYPLWNFSATKNPVKVSPHWEMNGNFNDFTQSQFNSTLTGSVTWTNDRFGRFRRAWSATAGNYVTAASGTLPTTTGPFSISVWMLNTDATSYTLLDCRAAGANGPLLYFDKVAAKAALYCGGPNFQINSASSPFDGRWHHLVGVWTGDGSATVNFYYDGAFAGSGTGYIGTASLIPRWNRSYNTTTGYAGTYGETTIWQGKALSAQEVYYLYNERPLSYRSLYFNPINTSLPVNGISGGGVSISALLGIAGDGSISRVKQDSITRTTG